jgi:hypothetical protein
MLWRRCYAHSAQDAADDPSVAVGAMNGDGDILVHPHFASGPLLVPKGEVVNLDPRSNRHVVPTEAHFFKPTTRRGDLTLNVQPRLAWGASEELEPRQVEVAPSTRFDDEDDDDEVGESGPSTVETKSSMRKSLASGGSNGSSRGRGNSANSHQPPAAMVGERGHPRGTLRGCPGYTAECSFQLAALYFGVYVSQERVRQMACDVAQVALARSSKLANSSRKSARSASSATTDISGVPVLLPMNPARHIEAIARELRLTVDVCEMHSDPTQDAPEAGAHSPSLRSNHSDAASDRSSGSRASTFTQMQSPGGAARHSLKWIKRHLDAAHVVMAGFYMRLNKPVAPRHLHDRVLPVIGYVEPSKGTSTSSRSPQESPLPVGEPSFPGTVTSGSFVSNADVEGLPVSALHILTLDSTTPRTLHATELCAVRREFITADSPPQVTSLLEYAYPKDDCVAVAVTGIEDIRRESRRVMIQLGEIAEPDSGASRGHQHKAALQVVSATVSGLVEGHRYALLRFSSPANTPSSNFLESLWDRRVNFTATGRTVQLRNIDEIPSAGVAIYRCVPC